MRRILDEKRVYPNWKQILKSDAHAWAAQLSAAAASAPFVLVCSSVGAHSAVITHDTGETKRVLAPI